MPKKNNYYIEINTIAVAIAAYFYYYTKDEEEYNDFYSSPISTSANWAPVVLSSFVLFLTSTTSLVLSLNPGRSNFRESSFQSVLNIVTSAGPSIVALAAEVGCKVSRTIAGDRAEAINEAAIEGVSIIEQASRFVDKAQEMHSHKLSRAIKNEETGEYHIRYTEIIAQHLDEAFITSTEVVTEFIWSMMLSGLLPRYFPDIEEKDQLKTLAFLYFIADTIESIGTKTISNFALSTEIIIDNKYISSLFRALKIAGTKQYKVEQSEIITKIKNTVNDITQKIREIEEQAKQKLIELEENLQKSMKMLALKAKEIEEKILEITHFKEIYKATKYELELIKHHFADEFDKIQKSALSIQSHFRGFLERKNNPTIKDFVEKKKSIAETKKSIEDAEKIDEKHEEEHHSFFHKLFHHPEDAKAGSEVHSGLLDRVFHHKKDSKSDSSGNKGKKGEEAGDKSSGGGKGQNKADLNEKDIIELVNSYISIIAKKLSEVSFTISSSSALSKTNVAPKNKEREEYQQAIREIEKNYTVEIKYEDIPIIKKPNNYTDNSYQKNELGGLLDLSLTDSSGLSFMLGNSILVGELNIYNNDAVAINI